MLALSTSAAPADLPLDRVLASFRHFGIESAVLHRPPEDAEVHPLALLRRSIRFRALFGEEKEHLAGAELLVIECGDPAPDRERLLDDLCRRVYALRPVRVALRTPRAGEGRLQPAEIALVCAEVPGTGYWHDTARGGAEWFDAAERHLLGASFDPRTHEDLHGLRDALPASAAATVWLPEGTARTEVAVALRRAQGVFRA